MRSPAKSKAKVEAATGSVHLATKGELGERAKPPARSASGSAVDTAETQMPVGSEDVAKKREGKVTTEEGSPHPPDSDMQQEEGGEEESKTEDEVISPSALPTGTESGGKPQKDSVQPEQADPLFLRMCEADYRSVAHIDDSDGLDSDMSDMEPKETEKRKTHKSKPKRQVAPKETPKQMQHTDTPKHEQPKETPKQEPPKDTPKQDPPRDTPKHEPPRDTPKHDPPKETPKHEPPRDTPKHDTPKDTPKEKSKAVRKKRAMPEKVASPEKKPKLIEPSGAKEPPVEGSPVHGEDSEDEKGPKTKGTNKDWALVSVRKACACACACAGQGSAGAPAGSGRR